MNPTRNDLSLKTRTAVCQLLNERLADLIDLGLQTKQAHWNVKGPGFIALHKLFDDLAGEILEAIDDVAERIVALGGTAEGTLDVVGKRTSLSAYPTNIRSGRKHVEALSSAVATAGKAVRSGIAQADELGDADSADLLTGLSRGLDQSLWFLEAHLQGDD